MRTWGVFTKPDQRKAASAASHPGNLIYVTVSENFMTACKSKDMQVPYILDNILVQKQGFKILTSDDVSFLLFL